MRTEVSKMVTEISMRSGREGIQDADLDLSGGNRLGLSGTKVIPTGQIHLIGKK